MAIFDASLGDVTGVKVGVGTTGLALSAACGAAAGVVAAVISHPADLVLTLQSADTGGREKKPAKEIISDLLDRPGGFSNLFLGLPQRSLFFFTVIGLQFLLYDYAKSLLGVGSDDLNLVLDVFYAVRQGLVQQ